MVMFTKRVSRVALIAVFTVSGGATLVAAQTAAGNPEFARMREQLKAGDRLTIHLVDGASLDGQFAEAGPDSLSVTTKSGTRRVGATDVTRVQRTRRGFLLGTIIGAGVGLACGAVLASYAENEGNSRAAAVGLLTAAGAGIGLGIDALINFPRTVYRQPSSRTAVQIDARPTRAAVGVTISF
jgi:hypothetical protein